MPAIYQAWNWIIPPDIEIDQSSPMRIDSAEPQIPNIQVGQAVSNEADRLIASLQTEEDQILQRKREARINNKLNKSLINYQAIQTSLKAESLIEEDQDIQQAILQQLEVLEAILEFKYLGKKEKLITKLQKQAQKPTLVQNLAQNLAQNQTQSQTQAQIQLKTYAKTLQTSI